MNLDLAVCMLTVNSFRAKHSAFTAQVDSANSIAYDPVLGSLVLRSDACDLELKSRGLQPLVLQS